MNLRSLLFLALIAALFVLTPSFGPGRPAAAASDTKLAVGDDFPDLILPPPGDHADYLGLLDPFLPFKLSQVDADIVLVEISSYFCGPCRAAVPELNALTDLTEQTAHPKVRLLSIGAGDSPDMVEKFSEQLKTRYPLLPDMDLELHARIGSVPAPHVFVVRIPDIPGLPLKLLKQKTGRFTESPREYLDSIRALVK